MRPYVIHFATQVLFPHFKGEEQQLLAFMNEDDPFRMRTIKKHADIQEVVEIILISDFKDLDVLLDLAHKVEAHIRFEERELFPYIESLLTDEELAAMGKANSSASSTLCGSLPK